MLPFELPIADGRTMFFVSGRPRAKPRQTQRDKRHPSVAVQHYRAWAAQVRLAWLSIARTEPWEGPVSFGAVFNLPVPRSWIAAKQHRAFEEQLLHTQKPDLDNLVKGVLDALNGFAWRDDSQIVRYIDPTTKLWVPAEYAGVWIIVDRLG